MAVSNLISNAIKYTPEAGKITVRLKITPRSIHISVKDNGVGISKKQMPDLFKKFSRLDNLLSVHAMGNGLGLYLARRVVELHKGRIKVASEHTIGSEFTIVLPRPKTEDPTAGSRKKVTKEE
jgi:signal transduction histidine kinase